MINKSRIVIVGPYSLYPAKLGGGARVHMHDLVEYLKKYSDINIHIVTVSESIKQDKIVDGDDVTVHYLSSPNLPRFITSLTIDQYKVMKKIKELEPDLVHAQMTAPLYGFPTALLSKKYLTLLTVHGIVPEEAKTWRGFIGYVKGIVYGLMERYTLKTIPNITVGTLYVKEKIKSLCTGKIYVIPVGVSENYFNIKNDEKENRLLFVGGIEPRKGLICLLKAVEIIKKTIPSINLHIVGSVRKRRYYDELKEYITDSKLTDNVMFCGFLDIEDNRREYGECSVFVLSSQEESQGLVLLEAMAAGKPIVASNIGGIPYLVDDDVNGFLFESGDFTALAKKITLLLENKQLRDKMGREGREKAKEFLSEKIAEDTYSLYKSLLGS